MQWYSWFLCDIKESLELLWHFTKILMSEKCVKNLKSEFEIRYKRIGNEWPPCRTGDSKANVLSAINLPFVGRLPRVSEYNTDDYSFNGTMQLLLNKDFSLIKVKKGQVLDIVPSMLLISYKERYNTEYIFFNFSRLSNTFSFCSMKFGR